MSPMREMNLIVDRLSLRRPAGCAVLSVILGLALSGASPATAQEPDAEVQTNDVVTAEMLTRISEMLQAAGAGESEEMVGPEGSATTNAPPEGNAPAPSGNRFERGARSEGSNLIQGPSQAQSGDRRSRGRRSTKSKSDPSGSFRSGNDYSRGSDRSTGNPTSGTNGSATRLDYAAFRVIVDRNIFDPNRVPHRSAEVRPRPTPRSVDSLTLVGTMAYEKGTFAFFDGSITDYKKALKLTDVIAGYKVTNISPSGVRLSAGTNELELKVGMQLRREEDGPWMLSGQPGSYAAPSAGLLHQHRGCHRHPRHRCRLQRRRQRNN